MKPKKITLVIATIVAVGMFALAMASPRVSETDVGKTAAMQQTDSLAAAPMDTITGTQEGFATMKQQATFDTASTTTGAAESVVPVDIAVQRAASASITDAFALNKDDTVAQLHGSS